MFYRLTGIRHIIGLFTLGTIPTHTEKGDCEFIEGIGEICSEVTIPGDDSSKFLLYGILGVFLLLIYIVIYIHSNRNSLKLQEQIEEGRKPQTFIEELKDYTNSKFHRLILALPILGIFFFTILPLVDMILMAFTNYDMDHQTPAHLFEWTGFAAFRTLFNRSHYRVYFGRF